MDKYVNDPFMNRERVKDRLRSEFRRYGKLIIAYDFDYTVHNFHYEGYSYEFVSDLLRRWRPYANFIVFTASPESRFQYIKDYLNDREIPFDAINEEVIQRGYTRKIYYNVFLDDRAGLGETAEILFELIEEIEKGKTVYDGYAYFGKLTQYEKMIVDTLRKEGMSDKDILESLKVM